MERLNKALIYGWVCIPFFFPGWLALLIAFVGFIILFALLIYYGSDFVTKKAKGFPVIQWTYTIVTAGMLIIQVLIWLYVEKYGTPYCEYLKDQTVLHWFNIL